MNGSKQAGMGIKTIVVLLIGWALASVRLADAQQTNKVPRIGFLGAGTASTLAGRLDALRQGLRDLGYIEGKNIAIEYRFADGKLDQIPRNAAELVRLKVDHHYRRPDRHPRSQRRDEHNSDSYDKRRRSSRNRCCFESCPAWRQYHGADASCPWTKRETGGAAQGDSATTFIRICAAGSGQPKVCSCTERDKSRSPITRDQASNPGGKTGRRSQSSLRGHHQGT